jgi:hypothetical protein
MSDDDSISNLIAELRQLQVRESNIIQEIESRYDRRSRGRSNGPQAARQQEGTGRRQDTDRDDTAAYRTGDRVYITNRVARPILPSRDWNIHDERRATVTRVTRDRVYFRTDNGTSTWRKAKNLRPIEQRQQ